jgi:hypothetical protein
MFCFQNFFGSESELYFNFQMHWVALSFPFGATAPIWALAYLHEALRVTSVY